MTGSRLVFDGDATRGVLKIAGPVEITNSGPERSILHMTGRSGSAEFDMSKTQVQDALRKAALDGSVEIDVVKVGRGGEHTHVTGDHLTYDNVSSPATIVLTGRVVIHGESVDSIGSASGIRRLTLTLNSRGEFTNIAGGDEPS